MTLTPKPYCRYCTTALKKVDLDHVHIRMLSAALNSTANSDQLNLMTFRVGYFRVY